MKLSVVIPCCNELENIPKLKNELFPVVIRLLEPGSIAGMESIEFIEMIFVDDGSQDGTSQGLRQAFGGMFLPGLECKFLFHEKNFGLGAALRTGFINASGDIILTLDCDGTYQFSQIPALLKCLKPGVDIVTASPYHPLGGVEGVPAYRLLFSKGSSFLYRILVNWHIHTYTCLFRAYRARVINKVRFSSNDFLGGTELLVKAILGGYSVVEYPAVLRKRIYGVSKARIARTVRSHLKFMIGLIFHRIRLAFHSPIHHEPI